jgi:hypothetical protein
MGKLKPQTTREPADPGKASSGRRKPYVRPTLRRLGSLRELTQFGKSTNPK